MTPSAHSTKLVSTSVVARGDRFVSRSRVIFTGSAGAMLTVRSDTIPLWSCRKVVKPAPWVTVYREASRAMAGVGDQGSPDASCRYTISVAGSLTGSLYHGV